MDAWTYDKIDEAVQILADIADSLKRFADFYTPIPSKDEPNNSEKPNNCEDEPQYDFSEYADRLWKIAYERGKREALEQTEATISKMEQVDEPQTDCAWR